jgi:carboxymethylenebutenolidase
MCELDHFEDHVKEATEQGMVTRRQFGALAAGAGLAVMLPEVANAQAVTEEEVNIKTPDGVCDAYFVHPATGQAPAVIIWPDIAGLRPAKRQMGKRLAQSGYSVLVVNPFYRTGKAPLPGSTFQEMMKGGFAAVKAMSPTTHVTDARAGTMGYCMGGPMVVRTAGASDRIRGAATFHSGALVTPAPDSPHLVIPNSKASFLIATAQDDDKQRPMEKDQLKELFAKSKLTAEVDVYAAAHGWCPPDSPVYNEKEAERAWSRMLAIFKTALA